MEASQAHPGVEPQAADVQGQDTPQEEPKDPYRTDAQAARLRDDLDAGRISADTAVSGVLSLLAQEDVPYIAAERENENA